MKSRRRLIKFNYMIAKHVIRTKRQVFEEETYPTLIEHHIPVVEGDCLNYVLESITAHPQSLRATPFTQTTDFGVIEHYDVERVTTTYEDYSVSVHFGLMPRFETKKYKFLWFSFEKEIKYLDDEIIIYKNKPDGSKKVVCVIQRQGLPTSEEIYFYIKQHEEKTQCPQKN